MILCAAILRRFVVHNKRPLIQLPFSFKWQLRDWRLISIFIAVFTVLIIGAIIEAIPINHNIAKIPSPIITTTKSITTTETAPSPDDSTSFSKNVSKKELDLRFNQATLMLHAKQYEYALVALDRVFQLAPHMPEAHVNTGFALLGMGKVAAAKQAFAKAITLKHDQANAYYGIAVINEQLGDINNAITNMQSYLNFADKNDPFRRKAKAAIWEWQTKSALQPKPPK